MTITLWKKNSKIETETEIDHMTTYYEWEPFAILKYFYELSLCDLGPIDTLITAVRWSFHSWRLHLVEKK